VDLTTLILFVPDFFCPDCAGVTSASARHCAGCGAELFDVYRAC
jgi:hypothetical protein